MKLSKKNKNILLESGGTNVVLSKDVVEEANINILLGFVEKKKLEGAKNFVINDEGEYELFGIGIKTIKTSDGLIHLLFSEDIKVCIAGGLKEKLEGHVLEEIGTVDILIIKDCEDNISRLISSLSPKVLIPTEYNNDFELALKGVKHSVEEEKIFSVKQKKLNEKNEILIIDLK